VLANLYRRTPMQSTFSIILLALVDGEPRLLNLRSALRVYLEHRLEVTRRRSQYELDRARERAHLLEGLRIALENLDQVVEMIRTAKDVTQAQQRLQTRLKLSEQQAIAILDMRLRRLSSLERKKINSDYRETQATIKRLETLLASPKKMRSLIANELLDLKNRFADLRRTQIVEPGRGMQPAQLLTAQDVIPIKNTWVVITPSGLISRTPTARLPRLSGRKAPTLVTEARTRDTLYIFSAQGHAVALAVHTLPECDDPQKGKDLHSATPMPVDADVVAAISLPVEATSSQEEAGYLVFGTRSGMVKKSPLSALPGPSAKPFLAIKLAQGDSLHWVHFTSGSDDLLMVNSLGYAIRFSEDTVRPMGLAAVGVQGMRIDDPETRVICLDIAHSGYDLLLLTEDGRAKRSAISQYPKQGRHGKGVLTWKSGEDINLVGAALGKPDHRASALLLKAAARSIRFDDAPRRVRTGAGKPLFELKPGDQVVALKAVISRPDIPQSTSKARKTKKTETKKKRTSKKSSS
jgi:DNA gyrase subunit A